MNREWLLVALAFVLLSGCVAKPTVRLESLQVFDTTPQALLEDMWGWEPDGKVVELKLSADQSFRALSVRYGVHMHVDAYVCSDRSLELEYMHMLFDEEGVLTQSKSAGTHSGRYSFSFYFADRSSPRGVFRHYDLQQQPYDLQQQPVDVCVRFSARNMALQGFKSNIVIVPASQLADRLSGQ